MSASGFDPGQYSDRPARADAEVPTTDGRARDRAWFERVLEETERLLASEDALEPRQIEALKEVARRHPGERLALEPIAVELVLAVVSVQFGALGVSAPVWQEAAWQIAQALWEDPVARPRLETLWVHISGG
jgi:hypothetical protein